MDVDQDVIEFIRESLRANERIRDKGSPQFSQQTVVSKTTTSFDITPDPLPPPPTTSGFILGGGGSSGNHPFKITTKGSTYGSGEQPSYKVFLRSSIINGINGGPFTINGLNEDKNITEPKFIVAEATVTSNPFEVTDDGFTIKAVDENETDEVLLEDGKQTKLRLLIGKITMEDVLGENGEVIGKKPEAWQAVTTSFRTAVAFHNGVPVYILQVAPTHQSSI